MMKVTKKLSKTARRNPWIMPALAGTFFVFYIAAIINIISGGGSLLIYGVALISLIAYIVYLYYWFYKTKIEINSFGASIPTFILIFIPFVNWYWFYRYGKDFAKYVKRSDDTTLWGVFILFLHPIAAYFVQKELNKHAK